MKILCVFGRHNYGNPKRGLGYEYANFFPAFERLEHDVVFFESLNKSCYTDFSDMNRQLLEMVEQEKPDIIFCVFMTYEIWLETLELIREGSDAALIHWGPDDSWKYEQFSRYMAPSFDLYVTTYLSAIEKARTDRLDNFFLSQWAADSSRLAEPLKAAQCRYQVSFVGSSYGNRKQWVEGLQQRGVDVATFGFGWPNGPVSVEELSRIMRESQISLNFGDSGLVVDKGGVGHNRQIKARVFEVPGAGGLLLTEAAENLEDYYEPGKEIVVFDGVDDLVEKIEHLISHPDERDALVKAGYHRTRTEHTYESRFEPVIAEALKLRKLRPATGNGIDFARFEAIARSHRPQLLLKLLKYILLAPSVLILGKERGPRAARRILFELSWRLLGKKTYSVTSWAGRLFYRHS
jgi:spore maturation protein CgeB